MISSATMHLQVAGLRFAILGSRQVADPQALESHLASYRAEAVRYPDVVIGPTGTAGIVPAGQSDRRTLLDVAVSCYREPVPGSSVNRQHYVVSRDSSPMTIEASLPDTVAVVGAIQVALSLILPEHEGLLMHAAAVVVADRAIVFPGASGTGKTTASSAVPNAIRLGEDRCALVCDSGSWVVHSIPTWPGKYDPQERMAKPPSGVVLVRKARALAVRTPSVAECVSALLPSVVQTPGVAPPSETLIRLVMDVVDQVPCIELSFILGDDFWPRLAAGLRLPIGGARR